MRKRYLEDWIFYWLALTVKGFFELFPYRAGVVLGAGSIYLLSFLYTRRADIAYINLKYAFPKKSPAAIKRLMRRSIFNLALSVMEFVLSSKLDKEGILGVVDINGQAVLNTEALSGKGIIFLTAHYNSWELLSSIGAVLGYPSFVIAREQKYRRLNNLLNRSRSKWGCVVVAKGFSLKTVIKMLREGKCIGILADQNAGKNGIQVKLFDRYASTNPGFISLARTTNSIVVPLFLRRVGLIKHKLTFYPQLDLNKSNNEILADYNNILERYIRKNPEQWLWFHKRWKHSANKDILIISDGKPGHYKQSEVVARELKSLLLKKQQQEWGLDEQDLIRVHEIKVGWRNILRKKILYSLGLLSSKMSQGHLKILKWALDSESYKDLLSHKFDYIISAGSSLLPLNAILGYENRAVNINILNPGIYKNKFHLIFSPQHDSLRGKNVILYKGALSIKDTNKAEDFKSSNNIKLDNDAFKIGVLIGGSSKKYKMNMDSIKKLFSYIDTMSKKEDINLLVTTSRRTPYQIERLIKNHLANKAYSRFLIIAGENNPPGAFDALLSISDVVVTTSDSISMIAEALKWGKRVYVFKTGSIALKNEKFIGQLFQEGLLDVITDKNLEKSFILSKEPVRRFFNNKENINEALMNIL
ncbi:MAG: ELM1/GtrOC1 family putative glycosyltransferase [Candidatus Saelkia tenebricola]|nr:ELM1/GtrOC1 family putative glycosyltransferase [Candidatus Saelkia tenebricola]